MITVDEIRNEVNGIVDILKDVKTVEDCRALRRYGYDEECVHISLEDEDWNLKDFLFEHPNAGNVEIKGIGVFANSEMSGVSYIGLNDGRVTFDVFDSEYDEEYDMLEECTLDTLEEDYAKAVTALEQDL